MTKIGIMNPPYKHEIDIPVTSVRLKGDLDVPKNAKAIVVFVHGSGSSRNSPRNQMIALRLRQHNIATLLFDLLTEEEEQNYYNRFNIDMLASRLIAVTEWLMVQETVHGLRVGYFGASTGAAAALKAASVLPQIDAIVSRGGRPDLAMGALQKVAAPVLLVVGGKDYDVLQLNDVAYAFLKCEKKLKVIDGASHLFEEGDTLSRVADEAIAWFEKYLIVAEPIKREYV